MMICGRNLLRETASRGSRRVVGGLVAGIVIRGV